MKRFIALFLAMYVLCTFAWERETIWPKGKMPNSQEQQIAARNLRILTGVV